MGNIDPQTNFYLQVFSLLPALHRMGVQAVRDLFAVALPVEVEQVPLSNIEDRRIPVGGGEEIAIRIYTPQGQGPFPLFVYYHGGGWVIGDLETSDASCRMITNRTGCVVVSVDYRLAPENKYPVPVEDSYDALKWVKENALSINGNASSIIVGGDGAGGNLAAVVSVLSRDRKGPDIAGQVLIYPVTDLGYNTNSYLEFEKGFGLDRDLMIWFGDYYIRNEVDKKDKYVAPLQSDDLSNLPPALMITAEFDVLRDEGISYGKRLREAGVKVESIVEEGLVNGYFTNVPVFSRRIKGTISKIAQFIHEVNQMTMVK